jgi:hypothetical protein
MTKDVKKDMTQLVKDANLSGDEKVINVYAKIECESLGGEGNFMPKGTKFFVHPEHVKHLEEKKFAKKIGEVKIEVPDLDTPKEPIIIVV